MRIVLPPTKAPFSFPTPYAEHSVIATMPLQVNIADNTYAAVGHAYFVVFPNTNEQPLMLTTLVRGEAALIAEHKNGIKLWECVATDPRWNTIVECLKKTKAQILE